MKKIFALMIALMMLLSCAAFAEEIEAFNVEDAYEGVWVQFEDDGFQMYIPSDWVQLEIGEEILEEAGIYYAVASPDAEMTFQLAWAPLDVEMDMAELLADVQTGFPEAQLINFNSFDAVCFANADADVLAFSTLDTEGPGMYVFNFTPASSEETVLLSSLMMSSLCPIEAE